MEVLTGFLHIAYLCAELVLVSVARYLLSRGLRRDVELDEDAVACGVGKELERLLLGVKSGHLQLVSRLPSLLHSLLDFGAQVDDPLVEIVLTRIHVVVGIASDVYRLEIRLCADRLEAN